MNEGFGKAGARLRVRFVRKTRAMERILALDYGTKRTGVAVSDPLRIIANALDTVPTAELVPFLKCYVAGNPVGCIVVGKPLRMDGTPSTSFAGVESLVACLQKEFPGVEIVCYDERFTSVLAHRAMIEGGLPRMRRRDKGLVDRISATILLQNYMDTLR